MSDNTAALLGSATRLAGIALDVTMELVSTRAHLRTVLEAYENRFSVEGRGLVGPIDEEVKAAREFLDKGDEKLMQEVREKHSKGA